MFGPNVPTGHGLVWPAIVPSGHQYPDGHAVGITTATPIGTNVKMKIYGNGIICNFFFNEKSEFGIYDENLLDHGIILTSSYKFDKIWKPLK